MPLQWLQLQQRQKQIAQPRATVSEALTPQRGRTGGGTSRAESENTGFMANVRAGEASRKKAYEEEMQRKRDYYEEVGRKSSAIYEDRQKRFQEHLAREREKKATTAPTAAPLTKENMPETAMEVWKFISTLEPESQKFYIQRLKQKEEPTGYVEAAGKRVEVPGSVGMYRFLVDKGLLDPATDTIIEQERVFEKGTFKEDSAGNIINEATGETIIRKKDIPKDITTEQMMGVIKQATTQTIGLVKPGYFEGLDAAGREGYLIDANKSFRKNVAYILSFVYGVSTKEATRMADNIPKQDLTPPPAGIVPPISGEVNEEVVRGLRELFEANPDERNNIELYKEQYGEANVNKALEKEVVVPPPTKTTAPSVKSRKKLEEFSKYKAL